ncbi:thioredoxin H2-like [Punica granatum]|uniref:Thioredoxin H2-like n=1 Tax=Punica granatum TaxID=22663 RepID=A0A218WT88_PUNGR|nr:thioredoxin H2-like [Punica granatum]OWM75995.1 hypothetical protein CDL15_Pgr009640 [Punica granatum]
MGANASTDHATSNGYNKHTFVYGSSHGKASQVIEFHSSARWKAHFDASKGTTKLMVVDFTASWCGPCKLMEPMINDLATKCTDIEFIKIDVDELEDVAKTFGVEAMPTFLLIKNGIVVDKVVGAKKDELQKKIELHRN